MIRGFLRGLPLTRRERNLDLLLGAAMFAGVLVSAWLTAAAALFGSPASLPLAVVYGAVLGAALAVRRRWPATIAVVIALAYFAAALLGVPEIYAGNIAMFVAFYTVGAYSPNRRLAHVVRIVIIVGETLWFVVVMSLAAVREESTGPGAAPFVALLLLMLLLNVLYFGGGYYFGERTYVQLRERRALEERTAELEREREVTAAQAVALDRVRIARELHDIVAHHVSLMGVQAGAARRVSATDAAGAQVILQGVEASAREALAELRQLLETLRGPGAEPEAVTGTIVRGLAAVPGLVEETTAAGLPVSYAVVGDPSPVPDLVQVNLYRIAQEALTNVRRHAGVGASADVRLRYTDHAVELEVTDTGRAGATGKAGLGQVGMRERASASGGTIEMGPRARGGYLVRVRVPLTKGRAVVDA